VMREKKGVYEWAGTARRYWVAEGGEEKKGGRRAGKLRGKRRPSRPRLPTMVFGGGGKSLTRKKERRASTWGGKEGKADSRERGGGRPRPIDI